MTKDETLLMAIEVMQAFDSQLPTNSAKKAIQACKEALQHQEEYVLICKRCGDDLGIKYVEQPAQEFFEKGKEIAKWADKQNEQPAQEPVYVVGKGWNCDEMPKEGTKLYTHPAPSWQGLSDDEIEYWECLKAPPVHPDFLEDDSWREFARCIEQALRNKND